MIIGMDFGTTNTGAARYDGQAMSLLPLDPLSPSPTVCRTAIYMTRTGEYYLGSAAVDTYFNQNVGRPTRYRKVWVGEIVQIFAELPTFYRDVFVYEDEFSPGRIFLSIKTALRNRNYFGTAFQGNWYSISDLVAIFFSGMKMQMERQLGASVSSVVLGRPVHFSTVPEEDHIAQSRLLDAAFKAGFEKVYLEYEPVAAALAYERTLKERQTVLVFDFGGGTLDFTVMEIGAPGEQRVLATGGVPIAGDVFDQRLFRSAIPRHLGEGEHFLSGGRRYPIPAHIFDLLSQPHKIFSLNTPENLEMLRGIHQSSTAPHQTHALLKVVSSNYALLMFDLVERAKRQLSSLLKTFLTVKTADFAFAEPLTRERFEQAIRHDYEAIRRELLATIDRSGLPIQDIQRVIRTGGSSQIPLFIALLDELFGPDKVQGIDVFSSVTAGLAVRGHQIATGLADLPVYMPDMAQRSTEQTAAVPTGETRPVELEIVRRRVEVRQAVQASQDWLPERAWLALNLEALRVISSDTPLVAGGPLEALGSYLTPEVKLLLANLDDDLLLVTDQFKFISTRLRDLYLAQQASQQGVDHALPLEKDEYIVAFTRWQPAADQPGWIGLVTTSGQGRCFDARRLADNMAKRLYFKLERRYLGYPVTLFLVNSDSTVLAATNLGRAACIAARDLSVLPYDILRARGGEQVTTAGALPAASRAVLIDPHGEWLLIDPQALPTGGPPASRGQTMRRNFASLAILPLEAAVPGNVTGLTDQARLLPLAQALSDQSDAPRRAFHLQPEETLLACFLEG